MRKIIVLSLVLVLSTFALPLATAQEDVLPPDVDYEPEIRMTTLFAYSQDTLSPEFVERTEMYTHNFGLGFVSGPSNGPTFTTPSFVRNAPMGSENWNFSLWASGDGPVNIDLSLFIDGTELDQVNSGGISLTQEKQRVDFTGGNLPDNISIDQTLSIRWTVNSDEVFVGLENSECTIHWGSVETPTNLTISAGMYQIDDPYLESEGTPFRGEGENYSRSEVVWAAQARWALAEEQLVKE
nr:hypothetical protein [Euryarchaeota archaeon]